MQLSKRLQAVADMVTPGNRLADVGTDHGYVPIWLYEAGRVPSAIAMDLREGPLSRARENIQMHHLEDMIETRLSDGLARLSVGEADSVVIAGMGGMLMRKILEEGQAVLPSIKELILQPQSDLAVVRMYLKEQGFMICREDMVFEDGKYYPVIRAVHGENTDNRPIWFIYGRYLLEHRHPVLEKYLLKEKAQHKKLSEQLRFTQTETGRHRREELTVEDRLIDEALAYYKTEK